MPHLSRQYVGMPLFKGNLFFHLSRDLSRDLSRHHSRDLSHRHSWNLPSHFYRREGTREGFGRDSEHPSRAPRPLYKGLSEDLGRDEGMQRSCKTSQPPNPPCRKEDFEPYPQPFSNRWKGLNRRIAETVDSSTILVSRDTA